jgi:hypothetical protein
MRPQISPLDPNSEAGREVTELLLEFLATVEPKVAARRRARLEAAPEYLSAPDDTDSAVTNVAYPLDDVAAMTSVSLRWLQDGVRAGRIAYVRAGRRAVMTLAQIEQMLEFHTHASRQSQAWGTTDPDIVAELERRVKRGRYGSTRSPR